MEIKDYVVERMHRVYESETGYHACEDNRVGDEDSRLYVIGHVHDDNNGISRFWEERFRLEVMRCNGQFGQPEYVDLVSLDLQLRVTRPVEDEDEFARRLGYVSCATAEQITSSNYYLLELPTFLRRTMPFGAEENMKYHYESGFAARFNYIMSRRDGSIRYVLSEHFCNLTWMQRLMWRRQFQFENNHKHVYPMVCQHANDTEYGRARDYEPFSKARVSVVDLADHRLNFGFHLRRQEAKVYLLSFHLEM